MTISQAIGSSFDSAFCPSSRWPHRRRVFRPPTPRSGAHSGPELFPSALLSTWLSEEFLSFSFYCMLRIWLLLYILASRPPFSVPAPSAQAVPTNSTPEFALLPLTRPLTTARLSFVSCVIRVRGTIPHGPGPWFSLMAGLKLPIPVHDSA